VLERHLEHHVPGQLVQRDLVVRALHDQREHVEGAAPGRWPPAEPAHGDGEVDVPAIAQHAAANLVGLAVAGIAHELVVADARAGAPGGVRSEHGHHRTDPAGRGGHPQVLRAGLGDRGPIAHVAQVAHQQLAPWHVGRAPAAVAERHSGAERQLGRGVLVGAGGRHLGPHLGQPRLHLPGLGAGLVEHPDELLGLGVDHRDVARPPDRRERENRKIIVAQCGHIT
jgi:hypothetical protein